ncbi:MAG: hypothetical protein IT376_04555 [Polyangiaceae bacterium]|nr:hypothetical protein [Polyangiaceae bacterium]
MNRTVLLLALLGAAGATGCVNRTLVVSHERKAYVVNQSIFSATVYHCDASSGKPVCTAVDEELP